MTKSIPLTQGKIALVDDEDFEWLMQWKWFYHDGYAATNSGKWPNRKGAKMHRLIMNTPSGMETDHINCDKLDNRRSNLRICDGTQNQANTNLRNLNTSGYKGVSRHNNRGKPGKWRAQIAIRGKKIHIGLFENLEDAARAYDETAIKYYGEFAKTNFPKK